MDLPGQDPDELAECLDDLGRANRLTGGVFLTTWALGRLTSGLPAGSKLSILDLATGGADFPRAIAAWARRRGLKPHVLATDASPEILGFASSRGDGIGVKYAVADARALPHEDGSFDVATCSLFLHHLETDEAVRVLTEMSRVSRRGIIVNDLVRSWVGYWGTRIFTRVSSKNRLFRNDGPLSVLRAYTRDEMAILAARAGLGPVRFHGIPGYRVAMSASRFEGGSP
ncbi:MAG TPA: methyltransferase domain-containing protein [Rubrobacteraceae bacterium]|nr:methyltransferase domain-containing protein [Rubrobacteraceae bacterium]